MNLILNFVMRAKEILVCSSNPRDLIRNLLMNMKLVLKNFQEMPKYHRISSKSLKNVEKRRLSRSKWNKTRFLRIRLPMKPKVNSNFKTSWMERRHKKGYQMT